MAQKAPSLRAQRDAKVATELQQVTHLIDQLVSSQESLKPLITMLDELREGLPTATSGEVLSARVSW